MPSNFIPSYQIRADFSRAMSDMYGQEVPLYKTMLAAVRDVNREVLTRHPKLEEELGNLDRVSEERHGAIRLGTHEEMQTMAQLFAVMGMYPVDYYDLTVRDLPIHSTAFRPIETSELAQNPFRVFTSVLRIDIVAEKNPKLAKDAEALLSRRDIFGKAVRELLALHVKQGGLDVTQAHDFVAAATDVFRWHQHAEVSKSIYEALLKQHALLADIAGFKGPHINHLTPRVLDIDALYEKMKQQGVSMIPAVQGPPPLPVLVLLRQTSFQALSESIAFPDDKGGFEQGQHRARFGEVEQRGIALTPKGRKLYDTMLDSVESAIQQNDPRYMQELAKAFKDFPRSYDELRGRDLAYFQYVPHGKPASKKHNVSLEKLIQGGDIQPIPITYEDFLPVSAAGIFKSNLVDGGKMTIDARKNGRTQLASCFSGSLHDSFTLYATEQQKSLETAYRTLGLEPPARPSVKK